MWQPLSKLLDLLGKVPISLRSHHAEMTIGSPNERDAFDSTHWRDYLDPATLFDLWGPVPGSPWIPYHCVPLFAALRSVKPDRIGPTHPDLVREIEGNGHLANPLLQKPLGEPWVADGAWIILDLPGPTSVAAATRFAAAGYQPVCTFDHWPHPNALVKAERILAQLLRYASLLSDIRRPLVPQSPPVYLCDRDRLGPGPARPRDFDNRYFLDDSILPSSETLRANHIQSILCVVPTSTDLPRDDLRAYFRDLTREGFGPIYGAAWNQPPDLRPFDFPPDAFNVTFSQSGYRRSDSGGFGQLVPEPSSSSG